MWHNSSLLNKKLRIRSEQAGFSNIQPLISNFYTVARSFFVKKLCIRLIVAMFVLLPLLIGCSGVEDEIVEIREQFFVRQTRYILRNVDQFTGRTIRLEGAFFGLEDLGNTYYFVVRSISGCCGEDEGSIGFELYLGNFEPPEDNAWVEVTGVLELRNSWQPNNPVLVVTTIESLPVRGQDIVFA